MPTPLERMIDKACGYDPNAPTLGGVGVLECPGCKRKQAYFPGQEDPPGTYRAVVPCLECVEKGVYDEPVFWDKSGRRL